MDSMIDVVFLLLIYFIVTQKEIQVETLLGVNLPSAQAAAKKTNDDVPPPMQQIDVSFLPGENTSDIYYLNSQPYRLKQLKEYFQIIDKESLIVVNCGPNAKHGKLVNLLDVINEAELKKINVVNDASVRFVEKPIPVTK